jgi:hypothetical protein
MACIRRKGGSFTHSGQNMPRKPNLKLTQYGRFYRDFPKTSWEIPVQGSLGPNEKAHRYNATTSLGRVFCGAVHIDARRSCSELQGMDLLYPKQMSIAC